MSTTRKRHSEREARRIATIKERHGENFFADNAAKAGKQSGTKFNSASGKAAADARWAAARAAKQKKGAK